MNTTTENTFQDARLKFIFVSTNQTTGYPITMRIEKKTATRWMLENKCVVKDGNVRYLQIKDLGLGVCEVMLRPIGKVNSFVVKSFEA